VIADMSYHFFAYLVVSCSFTVEATNSDYGYDLSIYTFDEGGEYENGNIFVQLKSTEGIKIDRKRNKIKFRIEKKDVSTWENEPFPVYLVLFDVRETIAYAIHFQQYLKSEDITSENMRFNSINVFFPETPIDSATINTWRTDKNTVLEQINAVINV